MTEILPCQKPQPAYITEYKPAIEFAETQASIFWTPTEIVVEKDVHDIKTNMTEAEQHGVVSVLKLFTLYELVAGNEYWGGRVCKMFPKPCIQRMANAFSYFELNVHAPFYAKLNQALHLDTEEFYLSYTGDPVLNERMEFIDSIVNSEDDLLSLGVFSMVEGAILYSSFAFLSHFQAQGKNKLLNVVRGIGFSVRDENLHSMGGAYLYKLLKGDMLRYKPDSLDLEAHKAKIVECAEKLFEHEKHIASIIFGKGHIEGITETQLVNFVKSRINICLGNLDIEPIYQVDYDPISDWFYDSINSYKFNDFFTGTGQEYNRNWNELGFTW